MFRSDGQLGDLGLDRDHIILQVLSPQVQLEEQIGQCNAGFEIHLSVFRKKLEVTWNLKGEEYKTQVSLIEEKLRTAELAISKVKTTGNCQLFYRYFIGR